MPLCPNTITAPEQSRKYAYYKSSLFFESGRSSNVIFSEKEGVLPTQWSYWKGLKEYSAWSIRNRSVYIHQTL